MSTDPLDLRLQQILGQRQDALPDDPLERRIAELMKSSDPGRGLPTPPPGEEPGFSIREVPDVFRPAGAAVAGAGLVGSGILDPLAALFGLPGAVTDVRLPTDAVSDFFNRLSSGLTTVAERAAMEAGLSPEEIATAHSLGNFVGYLAPVSASVKTASLLLRTGVPVVKHLKYGNLVTDLAAGAIFGAALKEGEGVERLKHAAEESALFGVGRVILTGLSLPFRAIRLNTVRSSSLDKELNALLVKLEKGEEITDAESRALPKLLDLLNNEQFIANSPAAQEIMARTASRAAIVQAIIDVNSTKGSMGMMRDVAKTLPEAEDLISQFRSEFPALKFEVLVRTTKEGKEYDVFFGTRGLNNLQRKQFKLEGRFAGQKVWKNGVEYEYILKKHKEPNHIWVRRADGKAVRIRDEDVTDLPIAREIEDFVPEWDALYKDFKEFVTQAAREAIDLRPGMSEFEILQAAKEGKLNLDPMGRRAFSDTGAIVYPEELGVPSLSPEIRAILDNKNLDIELKRDALIDLVFDIEVDQRVGDEARMLVEAIMNAEAEGRVSAWLLESAPMETFEAAFDRWAAARGIRDPRAARLVAETPEGIFNFAGMQIRRSEGRQIELVVTRNTIPGEGAYRVSVLERRGQEMARPIGHVSFSTFDDAVKWAKGHGFRLLNPANEKRPIDYLAARTHFADRLRQDLWNELPEADRKIFNNIRDELFNSLEASDDPLTLEALSHLKGFTTERLPNGRILFRDINTGAEVKFGSERLAREALRNVVRSDADPFGGLIPPNSMGITAFTGGFDKADSYWSFDRILSKDFIETIPAASIRNVRDWLITIEERTGVPLFSKGFNVIDTSLSRFRNEYEPWGRQIEQAWKGLNKKQKRQVVDFWVEVEGSDLSLSEAIKLARDRGLSPRQIDAFRRSRVMFDRWHQMLGLGPARYINLYYTRIRPLAEQGNVDWQKVFLAEGGVPPIGQFWARLERTGQLARIEMDPEVVMHKYIRGLLWDQHVRPAWDDLARLTGVGTPGGRGYRPPLRVKDLPEDMRQQVLKNMFPSDDPLNEPVLPKPVRDVLSEYLTIVRGEPGLALSTLRNFARRLFRWLDIEGDERVLEEYLNIGMTSMYGAAMGMRPGLIARNLTQNIWLLFSRLGSKHSARALEQAMTLEGFNEALEVGAIRLTEGGIPYWDVIVEDIISRAPRGEGGIASHAVAAMMRLGLRTGHVSRKMAEKFMIPYSSSDHASRAWSYFWQKNHTAEWLTKFEQRKIGWDKVLEEGLPFFSKTVKDKFSNIYRRLGREDALRFIGKEASDEVNFIYGVGAQPAWMQTWYGRMFGMFGTWPLWAHEMYFRRMKYATPVQRMLFVTRSAALVGAFANMTYQSGVDLWNWMAPTSLTSWAGGPALDYAIGVKRIVDAPLDQKAEAFKDLARRGLRLAVPGQMAVLDIRRALEMEDPTQGFLSIMLGRPRDDGHWAMEVLFDDSNAVADSTPPTVQVPTPPSIQVPRVSLPAAPTPDLSRLMGNI